eukprot:TRINITY_DN29797_c0_g1_i1.p1 TRINITY_DN29797_c0_g1~~TRINITY_DN29797_c0_g1_i1.p1  ORF type:complete len:348 (+),score=98.13 TRINITY_DN29797_c0_g1_i1:189-1232(+)
MEVTVLDTADLPENTIISFHTGAVRRHAQLQKDQAVELGYASAAAPVRVDVMMEVGSHTFDVVPGEEVYEVPLGCTQALMPGRQSPTDDISGAMQQQQQEQPVADGLAVVPEERGLAESEGERFAAPDIPDVPEDNQTVLTFRIRSALDGPSSNEEEQSASQASHHEEGDLEEIDERTANAMRSSTSRKLQTAMMMRSYLDNHDVLRQMQGLMKDIVAEKPEDPVDYMIRRLQGQGGKHKQTRMSMIVPFDPKAVQHLQASEAEMGGMVSEYSLDETGSQPGEGGSKNKVKKDARGGSKSQEYGSEVSSVRAELKNTETLDSSIAFMSEAATLADVLKELRKSEIVC